jgi:hypothetical protein
MSEAAREMGVAQFIITRASNSDVTNYVKVLFGKEFNINKYFNNY